MAGAWTAVGILSAFSLGLLALMLTMLNRFYSVTVRIDGLHGRLDQSDREHREDTRGLLERIERSDTEHHELRGEIRALGDRIERRIDEHETRRHAG